MKSEITIISPAKIILFGEHFVVYGQTGIAIPVAGLSMKTILKSNSCFAEAKQAIKRSNLAPAIKPVCQKVCELLKIKQLPCFSLTIESNIPQSTGFGSSAALVVSIYKLFVELADLKVKNKTILKHLRNLEVGFHKNPSGIDTSVIYEEKPILFNGIDNVKTFEIKLWPYVMLAVWKDKRQPTGKLVQKVSGYISEHPELLFEYKELFDAGYKALLKQNRQLLGKLMRKNNILLERIGAVSKNDTDLCNFGKNFGSIGEKITGAGSGGASLFLFEEIPREFIINLKARGFSYAAILPKFIN